MHKYLDIFLESYKNYGQYLWREISHWHWNNYFYWLIGISLFIWVLEILIPWRKNQKIVRRDFWMDLFYLFFNFFLFSLLIYEGLSNVFVALFNDFLSHFGLQNLVAIEIGSWPIWLQFLLMFLVADFIQWNVHRLLHKIPVLWQFHKVHHSVKEMGFAAHFRFHWMETIIYKSAQYIPLSMIGFGIDDFFVLHLFTVAIGHLNHANIDLDYGPLKYVLNNPRMHIWHHSKALPKHLPYGMNFGISLSLWDYLFKTAYIPRDGAHIELGFEQEEKYPSQLGKQLIYPINP